MWLMMFSIWHLRITKIKVGLQVVSFSFNYGLWAFVLLLGHGKKPMHFKFDINRLKAGGVIAQKPLEFRFCPEKKDKSKKQDGRQGLCPPRGRIPTLAGKRVETFWSFGHDAPGVLSTRFNFPLDLLNPGWVSKLNASHTKVCNFRSH